jgi:hypothetical protein
MMAELRPWQFGALPWPAEPGGIDAAAAIGNLPFPASRLR